MSKKVDERLIELLENDYQYQINYARNLFYLTGDYSGYEKLFNELSESDIRLLDKHNINYRSRNSRLYRRLKDMIMNNDDVKFLTLTFSDETLAVTNEETRRKYVTRFLKSISNNYVANIDFGKTENYKADNGEVRLSTSREHYHALAVVKYVPVKLWSSNGYILVEKVNNKIKDVKKLSMYISKFTNHAIKKSTGTRYRLIYSRNK